MNTGIYLNGYPHIIYVSDTYADVIEATCADMPQAVQLTSLTGHAITVRRDSIAGVFENA